ncbi:unnamed protein product, partial [Polarella glacialis]
GRQRARKRHHYLGRKQVQKGGLIQQQGSVFNRDCRVVHHYNYKWLDGKKVNSLKPGQVDYIFIFANTAFTKLLLTYHDALQFRGYVSTHALSWAGQEWLWPADHRSVMFRFLLEPIMILSRCCCCCRSCC